MPRNLPIVCNCFPTNAERNTPSLADQQLENPPRSDGPLLLWPAHEPQISAMTNSSDKAINIISISCQTGLISKTPWISPTGHTSAQACELFSAVHAHETALPAQKLCHRPSAVHQAQTSLYLRLCLNETDNKLLESEHCPSLPAGELVNKDDGAKCVLTPVQHVYSQIAHAHCPFGCVACALHL